MVLGGEVCLAGRGASAGWEVAQHFHPITPVPYDQVRMMILHRNLMNCSPVLLLESKRLLAL